MSDNIFNLFGVARVKINAYLPASFGAMLIQILGVGVTAT